MSPKDFVQSSEPSLKFSRNCECTTNRMSSLSSIHIENGKQVNGLKTQLTALGYSQFL